MTIDERLEAVAMNLELAIRDNEAQRGKIEALRGIAATLVETAQRDGENIRALARIAESHERRLTDLEQQ